MFVAKIRYIFCILLATACSQLNGKDILLEFKGAYFHPTSSCFNAIYGGSTGLFGPEVTFSLCSNSHWYGFASVDYMSKTGRSIGLCNSTKMSYLPLAFGVKYFISHCRYDFYLGLGFQPTRLRTTNCSPFVVQHTAAWGYGGIAKGGVYIDIPCNFFVDLFVDYSFVRFSCSKICQPEDGTLLSRKTNMSGVIAGVGLGYRFN